ncbi:hypothetical protein E2I00_004450 [Balaenoptera physalus]|uniref:Uncharacterized protein n=1 Tax=Balaenoptera physalus TaxID=9770 RepID=A0A6A1Q1C1_BALPH|nr:hypothetical protein E2I00_004450 [Balaenoptera physalus]
MEVVARTVLLGRFQFLSCFMEQLRNKMHVLRRCQFTGRMTLGIAAFVAILHWIHLITLFENDRHFSHLSSLEREMTFRTEMVIIAFWYRIFVGIMNLFGLETKTCWNVTRVEPLNEVQSCEGMFLPKMLFGTQLGGLITVLCYFFNHGESEVSILLISGYSGDVDTTSPGKFFISISCTSDVHLNCDSQVIFIYKTKLAEFKTYWCQFSPLRTSNNSKKHFIALCLSNVAFMLPWQFAQFILFTQVR